MNTVGNYHCMFHLHCRTFFTPGAISLSPGYRPFLEELITPAPVPAPVVALRQNTEPFPGTSRVNHPANNTQPAFQVNLTRPTLHQAYNRRYYFSPCAIYVRFHEI